MTKTNSREGMILSDHSINTSRQKEMDLAKAILLFLMPVVHICYWMIPDEDLYSGLPYVFDTVIGGPLGAPVFMFVMGASVSYTRRNEPGHYFARAGKLFVLSLLLNVFCYLIPYYVGYRVAGTHDFIDWLPYAFFGNDILQFGCLAFLLYGILKLFKLKPWHIFGVGLGLSIFANFLNDIDLGNDALNIILGHFIGTQNDNLDVVSFFPLCNWFIVFASGLVFSSYLIRVKDKNKFYGRIVPPALVITVVYFAIGIKYKLGMFGDGQDCYYHIYTNDTLASIVSTILFIGLYYYVVKVLPASVNKIIRIYSENMTSYYCIHWCLVLWFCIVLCYSVLSIDVLSMPVICLVGVVVSVVSILCSILWKKEIKPAFYRGDLNEKP